MSNLPPAVESKTGALDSAGDPRLVYVVSQQSGPGLGEDRVDLRELWGVLWRGKWLVVVITALFSVGSVAFALLQEEWFRAEALLIQTDERAVPAFGGQLGGLAALAGVSVGGGGGVEPLAVLRSREFASAFIEDLALLPVLFAKDWDASTETWLSSDPDEWPDVRDAVKFFHENVLRVTEDRGTGLVTLAIEWTDPEVAAEWAETLVMRLNARLRQHALSEAETNVDFLRNEIASTNIVTLQQSLGRLLESEMQKLMLARGNEEFAFRVVDKPHVPKYHVRPKRALIAVLGTILGGLVGVLAVSLIHALRTQNGAAT